MIHPLQPLPAMQRLGWLPHFSQLKCRRQHLPAFRRGRAYPMRTESVKIESKERRTRRDFGTEPVTYTGRDLLVEVKDEQGNWHRFVTRPAAEHEIVHDHAFLAEHFLIPEIPDQAALEPKRFLEFKKRLRMLER